MSRFNGKRVFITGAGSGFGRRTAEKFAEEGAAAVYLVDIIQERLNVVEKEIEARGATAVPMCFDLADDGACQQAMVQALADAPLDILVCNAATVAEEKFLDITLESWKRQIDVNLTAYFLLARDAARSMVKEGAGVIL